MDIHILTHGRANRQITYDNLPERWQRECKFVVQDSEKHLHKGRALVVLPPEVDNLHKTRQWLLDNHHLNKSLELDDDLVFAARRDDDPTKFRTMLPFDYDQMFQAIEAELDHSPLVGVSHREGANRNTEPTLHNTRQMRLHAFDARILRVEGWRWDRLRSPGPEDFCMILQVLTRGYKNTVCNRWVHNQGGSNQSGGCSEYRTPEVHADACEHLAELFPQFVTVVEKTTKESWGGGTRKDVRIQWKKAHAYGRIKN